MAYTVSSVPAPFGAITIFRAVNGAMNFVQTVAAWKAERDTRKVLSGLSADQLQDVGLSRLGRV